MKIYLTSRKELTLSILEALDKNEIINTVQNDFKKSFNVNNCQLDFYSNSEIDDIEQKTGMSFHKGAIHCGSFSMKKWSSCLKIIKLNHWL
jgi:hypothetical protein